MNEKTCCVTGHRVLPEDKKAYVREELRKELLSAIEDGYTHFMSGFADGVDLIFSALVLELKEQHPDICLEAAIPYRSRVNNKNKTFQELLSACSGIYVHSETYSPSCCLNRNRYMVSTSSRVIAVYDGRERGGTLFTMRYAHSQNKDLRVINL